MKWEEVAEGWVRLGAEVPELGGWAVARPTRPGGDTVYLRHAGAACQSEGGRVGVVRAEIHWDQVYKAPALVLDVEGPDGGRLPLDAVRALSLECGGGALAELLVPVEHPARELETALALPACDSRALIEMTGGVAECGEELGSVRDLVRWWGAVAAVALQPMRAATCAEAMRRAGTASSHHNAC